MKTGLPDVKLKTRTKISRGELVLMLPKFLSQCFMTNGA